ncbi:galactosamine-6-phosphate isomerase [Pedobacter sp. CAN_A7]|uniref:galactosamine-6-phosphate isomerase n=1 Tax=Pedobacter sp. CAN_A7 TaxID=2787722 RepID=UPI0018CAD695
MKIEYLDDYDAMSVIAADMIHAELIAKKDLLFCAATGSSPLGTYTKLVEKYQTDAFAFEKFRMIKLDEWGGIALDHPQSCQTFLNEKLLGPLNMEASRFISLDSWPVDQAEECKKASAYLETEGPIDLCVLGLGLNGHIAFNEPAPFLQAKCHVTALTSTSMQHSMAEGMEQKPTFGLTLGMAEILQSKKIILLISGAGKQHIIQEFLSAKITTSLPASFLWLHPAVTCLIDQTST